MKNSIKKYIAEFIGTFILVLFGCGVAVLTGNILITSIAFGLSIVAAAYAIGDVSGCHVNPAVSLAMLITKRMKLKDFCGYVVAQIAGAFAGTGVLYALLHSSTLGTANIGANALDTELGITACAGFLIELILSFVFIYTILGVTADSKKSHMAGIVIGLTLCFVHLLGIRFTGTSVNPARSLAPAVIAGGAALNQLWIFILAPLCGGAVAACVYSLINKK